MDERADSGDYHHHHTRKRIDAQSELGVESPGLDPSPQVSCERASGRHRKQFDKRDARDGERCEHHGRPDNVDRSPARSVTEEQVEQDAERREKQDQRQRWKFNGHRYHRIRLSSSAWTVARLRNVEMMMPSPTAASAAATVITKNAITCLSIEPRRLPSAIKVRLTAFSINSIDIYITRMLRRMTTPATPIAKIIALSDIM